MFREPFNSVSHLTAAVFAALGSVWMLSAGGDDPLKRLSLLVYGASLVFMFAASTAYHAVRARPTVIRQLKKIDHVAIYLLIAGTYTPVCLHYFDGFWGKEFLIIIWLLAGIGALTKYYILDTPRWATAGFYVAFGWLALLAIGEILRTLPTGALVWLILGGFFFTIGALVYITKTPNLLPADFGFHGLWHIFVILGALCHFLLIANFIAQPPQI